MNLEKTKKEIEHIWEYYKVPIFSFIAIVIFVWTMAIPALFAKPTNSWNAYLINDSLTSDEFEQHLNNYRTLKDEEEVAFDVQFDNSIYFSIDNPGSTGFDQMAKFTALIVAKEIDFIVSDRSVIEHYGAQGGFVNLEEFLSPEILEQWEGKLMYLEGQNGEKKAWAISLPLANEKFAAIPLNSEKKEISIDFLAYIENYQK